MVIGVLRNIIKVEIPIKIFNKNQDQRVVRVLSTGLRLCFPQTLSLPSLSSVARRALT
jgi:hypothetical protein